MNIGPFEVTDFWFGPKALRGDAGERDFWFKKSQATDDEIRTYVVAQWRSLRNPR